MSDEVTNSVPVARLQGRVDGIETALARQESVCRDAARQHVDVRVYESERNTIRRDIEGVRVEINDTRRDLEAFRKQLTDQRRWVIGVVLIPIIATAAGLLMGVLT